METAITDQQPDPKEQKEQMLRFATRYSSAVARVDHLKGKIDRLGVEIEKEARKKNAAEEHINALFKEMGHTHQPLYINIGLTESMLIVTKDGVTLIEQTLTAPDTLPHEEARDAPND